MSLLGLLFSSEDLTVVGALAAVVAATIAVLARVAVGGRMGPVLRRVEPYQGLRHPPAPGELLHGGVRYDADDHLAAVLMGSDLPMFSTRAIFAIVAPDYWGSLQSLVRANGLGLPRSIVDARFRDTLSKIELTSDLLEPEAVVSADGLSSWGAIVIALGTAMFPLSLIFVFGGSWVIGLVYGLISLSWLRSVPAVRRRCRGWHWEHNAPIAGCGVVKSSEKRRWTCEDAVMIVQKAPLFGGMHVMLLGTAGLTHFGFANPADPDFITLWQRWNHLDPKPHLLA